MSRHPSTSVITHATNPASAHGVRPTRGCKVAALGDHLKTNTHTARTTREHEIQVRVHGVQIVVSTTVQGYE